MNKRKTVGSASLDLMNQNHAPVYAIDYEREMHKDYENEIMKCVSRGISKYHGDFYVVVLRKRERLLNNVYRNFFCDRESCPTPSYDQVVYKYHRKEEAIEFLWVVPDLETCTVFNRDALLVPDDEKELLRNILNFNDGTLDKLAKKLNNEE